MWSNEYESYFVLVENIVHGQGKTKPKQYFLNENQSYQQQLCLCSKDVPFSVNAVILFQRKTLKSCLLEVPFRLL